MKNDLFRKEALNRISSPDDLHATVKIVRFPVWLIMSAVLIVLAGAIVWGTNARVESRLTVTAREDTLYVEESQITAIRAGMTVMAGDQEVVIYEVPAIPVCAGDVMDKYELHYSGLQAEDWVYCVKIDHRFSEALYTVDVILDSVTPMEFLWN